MKLNRIYFSFFIFFLLTLSTNAWGEESEVQYLHMSEIQPGQIRFSSKNVEEKIEQAALKGDFFFNRQTQSIEGKYFDGKSLFPESDALPVVKGRSGYVLTDGHHHVLAADQLSLPWVPVKRIADLSNLSDEEFWIEMERKGWVYLYDLNGQKRLPPKRFNELIDDPNRYFAALTARKVGPEGDFSHSTGAEYPLWIKVGKDIPFIEFKISDALNAHHFFYSYEMGKEWDLCYLEKARSILANAAIPGLRVVPLRKHWTELFLNLGFHLTMKDAGGGEIPPDPIHLDAVTFNETIFQ